MCIEFNMTTTRILYTKIQQAAKFMHQTYLLPFGFFVILFNGSSIFLPKNFIMNRMQKFSKFENYVLNLTPIFRRHPEKNVNKLPPKCLPQFFTICSWNQIA